MRQEEGYLYRAARIMVSPEQDPLSQHTYNVSQRTLPISVGAEALRYQHLLCGVDNGGPQLPQT